MVTRVQLFVGTLGLVAGAGLGSAATYALLRPGEPASMKKATSPETVDTSLDKATKSPGFELKTKPSPVAEQFDFKGLLNKVAGPIQRPGTVVSRDGGGGHQPGCSHLRFMGIWSCQGNGHEGAVFERLIEEVEAGIVTKGGVVNIRYEGQPFDLARFWERQYSTKLGEDSYSGTVRAWCVAGAEDEKQGQRFTVVVTLDETGP